MCCPIRHLRPAAWPLLAGLVAALGAPQSVAQVVEPNYALTAPALPPEPDPEFGLHTSVFSWGPVRLAAAGSVQTGSGLSLEAGHKWFARVGLGRSLATDVLSFGGGYRFHGGDAVSMHVTRQLGHERLGLAVRYDWQRAYFVRFSYEQPLRTQGLPDRLRFSAGVRF